MLLTDKLMSLGRWVCPCKFVSFLCLFSLSTFLFFILPKKKNFFIFYIQQKKLFYFLFYYFLLVNFFFFFYSDKLTPKGKIDYYGTILPKHYHNNNYSYSFLICAC